MVSAWRRSARAIRSTAAIVDADDSFAFSFALAAYGRGSPPDALFCVERGIIRLSVTSPAGREAVLGLVTAGHWFGEASLFTCEPRGNDATAVVESAVLMVPAATLHALIDDRSDYLRQFLAMMGQRYKAVLSRMDDTVLLPFSSPIRSISCIRDEMLAVGESLRTNSLPIIILI